MARLDRLATVKAVAQLGAVAGGTFAYAVLQAVTPLDEAAVTAGAGAASRGGTALPARGASRRRPTCSSMPSSRMRRISRC